LNGLELRKLGCLDIVLDTLFIQEEPIEEGLIQ